MTETNPLNLEKSRSINTLYIDMYKIIKVYTQVRKGNLFPYAHYSITQKPKACKCSGIITGNIIEWTHGKDFLDISLLYMKIIYC